MALQQLVGTLGTPEGEFIAMLCADDDTPRDIALYWSRDNGPSGGVLALATLEADGMHLVPMVPYRRLTNGAVVPAEPPLTEQESAWVAGTRATLRITPEGYAGQWTGPNDAK